MTHDVKARARELLAAEYERVAGFHETTLIHEAVDLRKGWHPGKRVECALRVIEAALSEKQVSPSVSDELVEKLLGALCVADACLGDVADGCASSHRIPEARKAIEQAFIAKARHTQAGG